MARAMALSCAVCALLVAFRVCAQEAETAPSSGLVSPRPLRCRPPRRSRRPRSSRIPATSRGFIDVFGRFIGDAAAKLNSQIKGANEALGDIGNQTTDAAKDAIGSARNAAETIIGLPNARIVTGRERCATAPIGARPIAARRRMRRVEPRVLGPGGVAAVRAEVSGARLGHFPAEGECSLETVVTRAVCQ